MGELYAGEAELEQAEQRLLEAKQQGYEVKQRVSGYGWIKTVSFTGGLFLIAYDPERSTTCVLYRIWIY